MCSDKLVDFVDSTSKGALGLLQLEQFVSSNSKLLNFIIV
jgi:hypothetical protein